jgi:pimeloyl-ACP methyl ester carboxylesterase
MDHYAADAAAVVEHLDLRNAVHIGHSTGGGEATRYVARHGQPQGRGRCDCVRCSKQPLASAEVRAG